MSAEVALPSRQEVGTTAAGFYMVGFSLLAIGLLAVGSAVTTLDRPLWPLSWRSPFGRQILFVFTGAILTLLTARLSVRALGWPWMCRWAPILMMVLTLVLLVAALLPGISDSHRGSQRWIRLPLGSLDVGVQPSELAKLSLVAFLASWLGGPKARPRSFLRGLVVPALAVVSAVALVGTEDFGTAALLACIGGTLILAAGCRILHLAPFAVAGLALLAALLLGEPYRMERLRAHDNMWNDIRGKGYQPIQSLTTIASGGWTGVGLGAGIQKHGYLPESHTDFIFSALCEESGVLGGGLVLGLFAALMWLGFHTFREALTPFEKLLALGLSATIGAQAAMNIMVVTALTPTKGISLPFVSAGGSGTLTYCVALGVLIGIALRSRWNRIHPVGARVDSEPSIDSN